MEKILRDKTVIRIVAHTGRQLQAGMLSIDEARRIDQMLFGDKLITSFDLKTIYGILGIPAAR